MNFHRRVGSRAPLVGLAAAVLALLLLPSLVIGADWSALKRASDDGGSRLDSLHQVAAARDKLHLLHVRIGPRKTDDRVVYQRSRNGGASWTRERVLFSATNGRRHVVPNVALAAQGDIVVAAWRVNGSKGNSLFVRISRDGGQTFAKRVEVFSTRKVAGVGVPAVAVGNDVIAVAWTNRADGKIKIRTSRDDGRTFKSSTTLGQTKMSIDCRARLTDGLVGLAINNKSVHVAWSHSPKQRCFASSIRVRTALDRGKTWSPVRTITERDTFGWPELDARGKTVLATAQTLGGSIVVARSARNGRNWREQLLKPPSGRGLSGADVVLLPRKKAVLVYVNERIREDRLVSTRLVSRRSKNDGASWQKPKAVTRDAKLLRMSPNVVANESRVTVVVQSGQLDGSPRNIYASRLR